MPAKLSIRIGLVVAIEPSMLPHRRLNFLPWENRGMNHLNFGHFLQALPRFLYLLQHLDFLRIFTLPPTF